MTEDAADVRDAELESARARRLPQAGPGQFTFVMATGIVSTALHNTGAHGLSEVLLVLAVTGYVVLAALVGVRWATERSAPRDDLHTGTFTVFAFTAATGVLAARFAAMAIDGAAITLTAIAAVTWFVLGYVVIGVVVRDTGTRGLARVDGTWFLVVVATQSVAVSSGALADAGHREGFAVLAAICWSVGLVQLILIAALMAARLLTVPLRVDDEVAPFWVFMGAGAISVLAGAEILGAAADQTLLDDEVVASVSTALWAFATWLIPLLIALTVWHARRPEAVTGFRTALWSMVFPIGMYGEASHQLGVFRSRPWLESLGAWESWVALSVWAVVFVGMLVWWARWLGRRRGGGVRAAADR